MTKGYPRTRFRIIDESQIKEIPTNVVSNPVAFVMLPYTSDKGSEDWEVLYGFEGLTDAKGGISFKRHGIPQLMLANLLRNGAYVLGKRMVSDNATLANVTIYAKVVKANNISYVYYYGVTTNNVGNMDAIVEAITDNFDATAAITASEDIPLFTVAAKGRGASNLKFGIEPIYSLNKNSAYVNYYFYTFENEHQIDKIKFSMNLDVVDAYNISQAISEKVTNNSSQVNVEVYEDGVLRLLTVLCQTAKINNQAITVQQLVNLDFINGCNKNGDKLTGIVCAAESTESSDLWTTNKPSTVTTTYDLSSYSEIPLAGGSNGTFGDYPIEKTEEYTGHLLGVFGKNKESSQYSSEIYDLDHYKIDCIFDCNWPVNVKNAIIEFCDFREDIMYFADLGIEAKTLTEIKTKASAITKSRYVGLYHNFFKVNNDYEGKQITVTMPYLLAPRVISYISSGIGKPLAGIVNNMTFPEIINKSVNFMPMIVPGLDEKQELVDSNVNFLCNYDGVYVMDTMYNNVEDYTQLSYIHNVMQIQSIIKYIRSKCPLSRYIFMAGTDFERYKTDVESIINQYKSNFAYIAFTYYADPNYEDNNIFYAGIRVRFFNFIQEELFDITVIDSTTALGTGY